MLLCYIVLHCIMLFKYFISLSSRFDDLQDEMIEDDIINPNREQPMSVADQSEILEV